VTVLIDQSDLLAIGGMLFFDSYCMPVTYFALPRPVFHREPGRGQLLGSYGKFKLRTSEHLHDGQADALGVDPSRGYGRRGPWLMPRTAACYRVGVACAIAPLFGDVVEASACLMKCSAHFNVVR
jgi:hypothetical protein